METQKENSQGSQLITKALYLSCGVHFFLLSILVFCFPISDGIKKPFFFFLGSILQKQDFLFPGLRYPSTSIQFNPLLFKENSSSAPATAMQKPHVQQKVFPQKKQIFKNFINPAPVEEDRGKNQNRFDEKRGDHLDSVPPYVPLRFQINDKN